MKRSIPLTTIANTLSTRVADRFEPACEGTDCSWFGC